MKSNTILKIRYQLYIVILLLSFSSSAQITSQHLVNIHSLSTGDINGLVQVEKGMLVYNTDSNQLFFYDGSKWTSVLDAKYNDELNMNFQINGTYLELTDAGGTLKVPLNSIADTTSLSDRIDANKTDIASNKSDIVTNASTISTHITNDTDTDPANELQMLTYSSNGNLSISGGNSVTIVPVETNTSLSQNTSTGKITHTNEQGSNQTANVTSTNTDNRLEVGTDGGAYLGYTVYHGVFLVNSSSPIIISGLPFEPTSVTFVAHPNIDVTNINADNGVGNNQNTKDNVFGTANGFAQKTVSGGIKQQSMFVGGSGASINDISRYASSGSCLTVRYANNNGDYLGKTFLQFSTFTADGFRINIIDMQDPLLVMYTAYR